MSLYPAPPSAGYYDRIYSRYTGDIYGPTLFGGTGDEKTIHGDWSTGLGAAGTGLGFSTSGPYGMMMTSSYEQFARNAYPPEMELASAHGGGGRDFMAGGGRLLIGSSARLKPEPEIVGDAAEQLRRDSSDNSTGSEMASVTAAAADTSGDDVIREKQSVGVDVETASHVFAPDSEHHGHERHCLLWACKTCKKRSSAAVDRRKV